MAKNNGKALDAQTTPPVKRRIIIIDTSSESEEDTTNVQTRGGPTAPNIGSADGQLWRQREYCLPVLSQGVYKGPISQYRYIVLEVSRSI